MDLWHMMGGEMLRLLKVEIILELQLTLRVEIILELQRMWTLTPLIGLVTLTSPFGWSFPHLRATLPSHIGISCKGPLIRISNTPIPDKLDSLAMRLTTISWASFFDFKSAFNCGEAHYVGLVGLSPRQQRQLRSRYIDDCR